MMINIIFKIIPIYFLLIFNLVCNNKEIEITATSMEWNKEANIAIATGEAQAKQGKTVLYADKIVVFYKDKEVESIKELDASGNVKFVREGQIATGDNATYAVESDKIFIKGNVLCKEKIV